MVKKSLLLVYRTLIWLISIVVVVLLVTALTIHFLVLPNINQYKDKIAGYAAQAAGQKIAIGNIKAGWLGINPHFSISNIDIFDAENRPALQLKNTDVKLSWLSIPMLEPRLAELIIRAPELTIRRMQNGEIFVAGISMSGESKPALPNWLLRQSKVEISNAKVVWLDEMRGAPILSLDKLNLQIYSPPWKSLIKNHQFTFSALPSAGTNNPITFNGNVYGNDVSKIEQWRGRIEMQIKNADVAAFKPWIDYPIDLQSGFGSTKVIVNFAKSRFSSITSDLALNNVHMRLKADANPIVLNKLAGTVDWRNLKASQVTSTNLLDTGYSISVDNLTLNTSSGLNLQNASASFTQHDQNNELFNLKLAHINLASISPYLTQLPLPADVLQKITILSPKGNLANLVVHWEGDQTKTKAYVLNTKFSGLSMQAHEKIPGFDNLTGEIKANQEKGKLNINTQNAKLDFKDVLRWPIPVDKLDGTIDWEIDDEETEIQVSNLVISNPHLAGSLDAKYLMDGKQGGLLDLKAKFGKGNAKNALFYYPIMLGEDTLHWLDTSILAGRAEDINLVVKGRLDNFPFVDSKNHLDSKLGLFRVTAKISDSVIEYGTGWPVIADLGLDLLFEGKRMELNAHTGHLLNNRIVKSKATIEQLDAAYPILNLVSEIKGPVSDGIKFVNESPVFDVTQGFTEDLKTSGSGNLNLSLKIPLDDLESSKYKGLYQITNGSMESASVPTLSSINGVLEFTESSLTAKNIKASAFGAPLVFNLNSGKDKVIRVAARGRMNDEAMKQLLGKGANYFSGSTDWVGDIMIQKPLINIGIRTDLLGLTSRLPAPFDKAANERVGLRIDKKQDANTDTITVNLGTRLGAKIIRSVENGKLEFSRGVVNISGRGANSSGFNTTNEFSTLANAPKGLQVYGNLDYLDADAWRSVADGIQDTQTQDAKGQELKFPIGKTDFKINSLDIFNRRINQLRVQNKSGKDDFQFNVQSREITGDLQWLNQDNGKLIARLSNLTIPDASPISIKPVIPTITKDAAPKTFKKLNQDYPALDITANNFEFDKKKLGGLELVAFPRSDDWIIQKLKIINPESTISAEGEWNNWVRNPNTHLNVTWDMKDLGKTMKRLGYPDTIKDGEGELNGQLSWAGSPHEFDVIGLNGNLQFEVRKGQILKVQPGVGRLFGLLSLQSLPRRLSLDFRDLFNSGFAFDKIEATVKIDRGVLRSDNFTMSGPAADVKIKGETNIQKETQHLNVKVMPHISDSISLAALAGGPLAGAVAFLAQKVLKDPLNKIIATEYEITGTWDNPIEVKAPDNDKEMSSNSPLN